MGVIVALHRFCLWTTLQPVAGALLRKAEFIVVHYSWRPISPDEADDHVIDCAMNVGAVVITANVRHFRAVQRSLGLVVLTPLELITRLASPKGAST